MSERPIIATRRPSVPPCPRADESGAVRRLQGIPTGTIIDFDGEPGRPLFERRLKRSPLHDVASMVRSFHYAAHAALAAVHARSNTRGEEEAVRLRRMAAWQLHVGAVFIDAYSRAAGDSGLLPAEPDEARLLFRTYLVERAFYELGFELNQRRNWIAAPLIDLPLLLAE